MALNAYAPHLPELLGGSADLTSSNLTNWEGVQAMRPDTYLGRHINYGVREFGMCAILNGIACTADSSRTALPSLPSQTTAAMH